MYNMLYIHISQQEFHTIPDLCGLSYFERRQKETEKIPIISSQIFILDILQPSLRLFESRLKLGFERTCIKIMVQDVLPGTMNLTLTTTSITTKTREVPITECLT